MGATVAYEFARRGRSVVVVDAGSDVGHGCSYANAGLLSPGHVEVLATPANVAEGIRRFGSPDSPLRIRPRPQIAPWLAGLAVSARPARSRLVSARLRELARASLALHLALPEQGVETGVRRSGSLDVHLTESGWRTKGPADPAAGLLGGSLRDAEPELAGAHAALPHPDDAVVESRTYVRALLRAAAAHGARVRWDSAVTGVEASGGRITGVRCAAGRISPGLSVLAAGLGSRGVAARLGVHLPLRGARGYVVDLAPVPGHRLAAPLTLRERRVVATPYEDRLRLCGTLELGADDVPADPRRFDAVLAAGRAALGAAASGAVLERWAGLRPTTPDGAPVIGRSTRVPDLLVATGHGMWGLVLAPITAKLLADGALDEAPTLHEPALSPDRFDRPRRYARSGAGR